MVQTAPINSSTAQQTTPANQAVVFRLDSSAQMGGGHLFRCLTLAKELGKQVPHILFICADLVGSLANLITQAGFEVQQIKHLDEQVEDALVCRDIIEQYSRHHYIQQLCLVVDHYQLDTNFETLLSPLCQTILVIDDLANRKHHCDLLFDQSIGRSALDYRNKINQTTNYLLGAEYALINKSFTELIEQAKQKRKNTEKISSLLISLSATDPKNQTGEIIRLLETAHLPTMQITVVLTSAAPFIEQVKQQIEKSPLTITLVENAINMAELILQADIAIGAAGTSFLERCCLGLPSVIIELADNQHHICQYLAKQQLAISVLTPSQLAESLIPALSAFINATKNAPVDYEQLSATLMSVCNGRGKQQLVNKLMAKLTQPKPVTLKPANQTDMMTFFDWQQLPETRQYARNPEPPSLAEHQTWFRQLLQQTNPYCYVILQHNQAAGFVRLNTKSLASNMHGYEVSIAIAPEFFGQGLGSQSLNLLAQLHPEKTLFAYIDSANKASIRSFAKAGFTKINHMENWYQKPASTLIN